MSKARWGLVKGVIVDTMDAPHLACLRKRIHEINPVSNEVSDSEGTNVDGRMTTALEQYDAACQAVSEARTVDAAKGLRDTAEAIRVYARQSQNKDLEINAVEIRLRAERRLGELIAAQKTSIGLNKGQLRRGSRKEPRDNAPPTLADAGIDKKLSSQAQKLAAVPEKEFERRLGDWRDTQQQENGRVTRTLLKPDKPILVPRALKAWNEREAMDRITQVIQKELTNCPREARVRFGGLLRQQAFYFDGVN